MAKKNYVLDTNVLLHDPRAMYAFADNHVVLPIYVIEEIDTFKKDISELGRNARQVARQIDDHRANGGLAVGVPLENGGTIRVALGYAGANGEREPLREVARSSQRMDNLILDVALAIAAEDANVRTILVTKDVNMRIRGDALGLHAVDYDAEQIVIDELYAGAAEVEVPGATIDAFYADGQVAIDTPCAPNQYMHLKGAGGGQTALARFDSATGAAVPIRKLQGGVWGIRPRNKEQHYALDLLLSDDIKLVTLVGKAGTGKTLLALAAGLHKALEDQTFQKLLVARPIFPLGRDIGYLPGDIEEKLNPWMQPIYDNMELLLGMNKAERKEGRSPTELFELGYVEIEPLTYIRGRSLPNVFMIVDEAQNLTPHEIKTILTRAGDGTKIVLTGDPYQIDNPYIDSSNNGLTTVVERFKAEAIAGHITLTKGERSELAELATRVL
ncbi:MAG TPA: PhoH family protein [Kofleriaceae bacterium]|nr:PhoH family protein [Kofleriaceae bacterium]